MELKTRKKAFWATLGEHSAHTFNEDDPLSYANIYAEWRFFGFVGDAYKAQMINALLTNGYKMVNGDIHHCVCGAPIKYRYLIINPFTKKFAFIGSECKERFYMPNPSGKKMALAYILFDLRNKLEILHRLGVKGKYPSLVAQVLGLTVKYIEKLTKYKQKLKVGAWYAKRVEELTGIKWKWDVWSRAEVERFKEVVKK